MENLTRIHSFFYLNTIQAYNFGVGVKEKKIRRKKLFVVIFHVDVKTELEHHPLVCVYVSRKSSKISIFNLIFNFKCQTARFTEINPL